MFRNLLSVCVVVASLSTSASAGVMSADHARFGVGSLTRDTVQGLDFLDLPLSVNRSFNDVSSQFGAGGDFDGFRYATEDEVINLVNNYGFTPGAISGAFVVGTGISGELSGLVALLGVTSVFNGGQRTFGLTNTMTVTPGVVRIFEIRDVTSPLLSDAASGANDSSQVVPTLVGSFLVQTSSIVPEPGSITAFAGLLGIGLIVRRRKQRLSDR